MLTLDTAEASHCSAALTTTPQNRFAQTAKVSVANRKANIYPQITSQELGKLFTGLVEQCECCFGFLYKSSDILNFGEPSGPVSWANLLLFNTVCVR